MIIMPIKVKVIDNLLFVETVSYISKMNNAGRLTIKIDVLNYHLDYQFLGPFSIAFFSSYGPVLIFALLIICIIADETLNLLSKSLLIILLFNV